MEKLPVKNHHQQIIKTYPSDMDGTVVVDAEVFFLDYIHIVVKSGY